tara:strand:+ start:2599 stop:3273 length:675 start_codon:yes stop_codon:yes gene_type:complete
MFIRSIIIYLIFLSFIQGKKINNDNVKKFIISRYEGDTSTVSNLLSENFSYIHPPMVGLGVHVVYKDGRFEVLKNLRIDSLNLLLVGDKIFEINNKKISKNTKLPIGPIGSIHKLILTRKNDSTFIKIDVPLIEYSYKQNRLSFIKSINIYSNNWLDFDVKFLDIIHKKNKVFVYYRWEGSKVKGGPVYVFYAMELLVYNRKKDRINSIETLWSKDIFMKQFLH